jgi:hypothetical protein
MLRGTARRQTGSMRVTLAATGTPGAGCTYTALAGLFTTRNLFVIATLLAAGAQRAWGDVYVTAIHGNVVVEQGARVAGDVAVILGDLRVQSTAQVAGDVVTIGGTVRREPQASVAGDVTSLEGVGWAILIFLLPLALVGGTIALIVWLIARTRKPAPIPA